MFCSYSYGIMALLLVVQCHAEDHLLTSSYSQVSHSGSARSHAGQTPWTHSSDAHIIRGQNLARKKPNRRISVLKKKDKLTHFEDGTGEVIQERFNPRPWFAYEVSGNKGPGPGSELEPNNMDLTVPFDSFPLSVPPATAIATKDKPSALLKPPLDMNDNDQDKSPIPPLNTYGSPYDSYNPSPEADISQSTKPPRNFITPNNEYLPPSEPESESDHQHPDHSDTNGDSDDMDSSPPSVPNNYSQDHSDSHGSDSDDMNLAPPSVPFYQHPHSHNQDQVYDEHDLSGIKGLPAYLEHDPNVHGYSFSHQFPHDHTPIYYEVKTTTEAPEKQRLNKRPYSYYYIGRKLWYIPLYFSVYFIIYIFVLILKSIARHKITFNQYFEEDKREMKDMHDEYVDHVHELDHHVLNDIMSAKRKYIMQN